jgi:HlyD family secretion protein
LRNRLLFILAIIGILAGLTSAYVYRTQKKPLPPVFNPAPNPFEKGIYSNGVVESYQANGANINLFPEVQGVVTQILAVEGTTVARGTALIEMDDSVQRALAEQQEAQARAALSLLEELKAQPRKETLEVSKAQVEQSVASLKTAQDQLDKIKKAHDRSPGSVSRDQLDNAENAVKVAAANLALARKQHELTSAGAWIYDIQNQQAQYEALSKAHASARSLLSKYTIRAPVDGVILAVNATEGSFISSQGAYATYTDSLKPVIVMGKIEPYLAVRCYIDEILIQRLPQPPQMRAQMFLRGTNTTIPLEFVRIQPYVTPKVQLSNQRTERVDVRVLPIVFRFKPPKEMNLYLGQLVDVYLEAK